MVKVKIRSEYEPSDPSGAHFGFYGMKRLGVFSVSTSHAIKTKIVTIQ